MIKYHNIQQIDYFKVVHKHCSLDLHPICDRRGVTRPIETDLRHLIRTNWVRNEKLDTMKPRNRGVKQQLPLLSI